MDALPGRMALTELASGRGQCRPGLDGAWIGLCTAVLVVRAAEESQWWPGLGPARTDGVASVLVMAPSGWGQWGPGLAAAWMGACGLAMGLDAAGAGVRCGGAGCGEDGVRAGNARCMLRWGEAAPGAGRGWCRAGLGGAWAGSAKPVWGKGDGGAEMGGVGIGGCWVVWVRAGLDRRDCAGTGAANCSDCC